MLKDLKSFDKAVAYHYIPSDYRKLVKCHFEEVYACMQIQLELVVFTIAPNNQN